MIRVGTLEDAPEIARLEGRCSPSPWREDDVRSTLSTPWSACFVTPGDGPLSGYILMSTVVDEGEVLILGVDPTCRRRGLGEALLAAAEGRWRSAGVTLAHLEVRADNWPAIGLYERRRWQRVGKRPGYYHDGTDALLFQWTP